MSLTAVAAGSYLHHIALASDQPEKLADFYAATLDMEVEQTGAQEWCCTGRDRRVVFLHGEPKTLAYAGFACRDADALADLRDRATSENLSIEAAPGPYFGQDAFAVRDPDGNRIAFGLSENSQPTRQGMPGPLQHLAFATFDAIALEDFYHRRLGFAVSDRVLREDALTTSFLRSNHEHHTVACFKATRSGIDHHSYEGGEWDTIRDWADHFAGLGIPLVWGPGRHGPGNNLFIFIEDPDGNRIEISAELEIVHDRPGQDLAA